MNDLVQLPAIAKWNKLNYNKHFCAEIIRPVLAKGMPLSIDKNFKKEVQVSHKILQSTKGQDLMGDVSGQSTVSSLIYR